MKKMVPLLVTFLVILAGCKSPIDYSSEKLQNLINSDDVKAIFVVPEENCEYSYTLENEEIERVESAGFNCQVGEAEVRYTVGVGDVYQIYKEDGSSYEANIDKAQLDIPAGYVYRFEDIKAEVLEQRENFLSTLGNVTAGSEVAENKYEYKLENGTGDYTSDKTVSEYINLYGNNGTTMSLTKEVKE